MSSIGMAGQGDNVLSNNSNIWIGDDGVNTFTFTNKAERGIIIVLWDFAYGGAGGSFAPDYGASFMNVRRPKIAYSLPKLGDTVTVSLANGISGGWSGLQTHQTDLRIGQINNTWGEFTTGQYATVDISREVNMAGMWMDVRTPSGCVSNLNTCVFVCRAENTCGASGTYELQNCQPGSQPGATNGSIADTSSGGCQGWSHDGHLEISLGT